MNGELFQICSIVAATKNALKTRNEITYGQVKYENKIEFQFIPQKKLLIKYVFKADSVSSWYEHCLKKGMQDVKVLAPMTVKDRNILGFSNTSQGSILCFFGDGKVSYFSPKWEFDSTITAWNILYTEYDWPNPPHNKPTFDDNTQAFISVLKDIEEFAHKIECDYFAETFRKAANILTEKKHQEDEVPAITLPIMPEKNLIIFEAVNIADVFGAMGSWNDSPPYMAHEKGLDEEYNILSYVRRPNDGLCRCIRSA